MLPVNTYPPYSPFNDPARYLYEPRKLPLPQKPQSNDPESMFDPDWEPPYNPLSQQRVKLLPSSGGFRYGNYKEVQDLISFLSASPTAWQAVDETVKRLEIGGYTNLSETENHWNLKPGGKYYVIRGGSSIIAFMLPTGKPDCAIVLGAHTDSPGFKLKPNPEIKRENCLLLSTQVYGGPIQPAWFNRSLGLAGRCCYVDFEKRIQELHVNIAEPIGSFSHLAIHLNRDLGTKVDLNSQREMNANVAYNLDLGGKSYINTLIEEVHGVTPLDGFEFFLVPLEKPTLTGPAQEAIESPRLDNLLGCDASIQALLASSEPSEHGIKMMSLWDNEEVGSETAQGAASTFLQSVLNRIMANQQLDAEEQEAFMRRSFLVSNDVAHGWNPNYAQSYEDEHKCLFGKGVVLKINANQRYATDALTQARITECFKKAGVNVSQFVVKSDSACGTTIGNIVAPSTGIPTVDLGVAILSMHAPVEKGSIPDQLKMTFGLTALLNELNEPKK